MVDGQGRHTKKDFHNFLAIALGSLRELETQILISQGLNYINDSVTTELCNLTDRVGRLIRGLAKSLMPKD
jgi:four helix bundle protein